MFLCLQAYSENKSIVLTHLANSRWSNYAIFPCIQFFFLSLCGLEGTVRKKQIDGQSYLFLALERESRLVNGSF